MKSSPLTHRTDGIVSLVQYMLWSALKKTKTQLWGKAGTAEVRESVTCKMLFHCKPYKGETGENLRG